MKFQTLTPYHFVANNPISIVDPNGKDTLIIHRSKALSREHKIEYFGNLEALDEYGELDVYVLTFTIVQRGKEKKLDLQMYMYGYKLWNKHLGDLTDDCYTLKFDKMSQGAHRNNDLRVFKGRFIHPGRNAFDYKGCYGVSFYKPSAIDGNLTFSDSPSAQQALRDMYNKANGGANGELLTGEKFLMKTDSKATESAIDLKLIKLNLIDL